MTGGAGERGQSTVELIALLPVAAVVTLTLVQVLAAGVARELAGHAAEAGAVAVLEHRDPRAAAVAALPGWSRRRLVVTVRGTRITVHVRPAALVPQLATALTATARATAGPAT